MKFCHLSSGIFLSVLALTSQILNTNGYTHTTTTGVSGPVCPPNGQCLSDATCIDNKCMCPNPTSKGLGHFLCHRPNQIFCSVLNDPFIRGFDESTTHAPLSCKFKLTNLRIPLCDSHNPDVITPYPDVGTCFVKVQAWGSRLRGKTFIKGMDFRFKLDHVVGGVFHHLVRIIATANNGAYLFKESGTHVPNAPPSTGPARNRTIMNQKIYTTYDHANNFARIVVAFCGVEVGIRGVDSILNPRDTTAGVYVKVFKECNPTFVDSSEHLCSPPAGMGPSLADKAKELSEIAGRKVSTSVAAMHTVMTSDVDQTFPGAAPVLANVTRVAKECPGDLFAEAMEQSSFILSDIKFMKCFDKTESLEKALELFKNAVHSICTSDMPLCAEVQKEVSMSNCPVAVTEGTIMDRVCPL